MCIFSVLIEIYIGFSVLGDFCAVIRFLKDFNDTFENGRKCSATVDEIRDFFV